MTTDNWHDQLGDYLREKNHSDEEIAKVLALVKKYDVETSHDSVMDAIAGGQFDLAALIDEALGEDE